MMTAPSPAYGTSPIQRTRYTRDQREQLERAIVEALAEVYPMTLRQLYYRLVSEGAIEKTEAEYKRLSRVTVEMRREGRLPFSKLTDTTRFMRKHRSYSGLHDLFDSTSQLYRRDLWQAQSTYVEVWIEKDALSGVAFPVTQRYDVPLMVSRGFASWSFIHGTAETIRQQHRDGKRSVIYYLGDYDPSGSCIDRSIERSLRELTNDIDFGFERIAVTKTQIAVYGLPTRPTKKSDSRAATFGDDRSVELDALPAQTFKQIIEDAICNHIDQQSLAVVREAEASEREWLEGMAQKLHERGHQ